MDPNFVLRHARKPTIYYEGVLRRDPNFMPQLYLYSTQSMGANKFGLYFSQVLAASPDPNDQSVRVVDFLKRKRTSRTEENPDVAFAIDERAAKFYLGFGQHPDNRSGPCSLGLKIFDLDFDPVDQLGYRRIRIRSECLYEVKPDPLVPCALFGMAICPVTGKLFGHVGIREGLEKISSRLAEIELPKANESMLRAKLSDHKFETIDGFSRSLNCRGTAFSRLGHLLIFFPLSPLPQSNKLAFVCSYDTDLNVVRHLAFDPIDLVCQFFPQLKAHYDPGISRFLSMLVGRTHKYVLFLFGFYIPAVKWPRNWYTGKQLPPVQISRVINLKDFMDKQQVYDSSETPARPIILTNTHLYIEFHLRDKPKEIKRLELSPKFKDYRQCANCGKVEKRKRRNKDGKRIAKFKVCRLCKERNFHLFYLDPENACHYCSDECQKKHWKTHKDVHKRSKLNRKTYGCKPIERFD